MPLEGYDLEWEEFALQQEATLIAAWTIQGRPQAEIDKYLRETGYGKRLAAYKAALGC